MLHSTSRFWDDQCTDGVTKSQRLTPSLGGWEPKFNCFIFFVNYLEGRSPMDKTSRCSAAMPPVWPTPFQPHLDSRALKEHNFLLWTSMHKLFAWSYHDQFIISWKKSRILRAKRRRKICTDLKNMIHFWASLATPNLGLPSSILIRKGLLESQTMIQLEWNESWKNGLMSESGTNKGVLIRVRNTRLWLINKSTLPKYSVIHVVHWIPENYMSQPGVWIGHFVFQIFTWRWIRR